MGKLFGLFHRDKLQSKNQAISSGGLVDELDNLSERISTWCLVQHKEDGTHSFSGSGSNLIPIGGMIRWPLGTAPSGWILCDGSAVSRTTYANLFKVIGISSGAGNGSTTFNVPNVANFIILAL
jgi:hypothetical protein